LNTAKAFLNPILEPLVKVVAFTVPVVDCKACAKPIKCCDFQPFWANFLIGAWLEENGAKELPEITNAFWHPIGLIPRAEYRTRHAQTEVRGEDLKCGFYQSGRCEIWSTRPGECSTYFCDSAQTMRAPLSEEVFHTESAIAQMALAEIGLSPVEITAQVDRLNSGQGENGPSGDLILMYKKAWKWSKTLSRQDVRKWLEEK
jgi:hypothetical protein